MAGQRAWKLMRAKRCFCVRWIHDFETRQQVLSAVGSSRIWSTTWSSISGGRGDDIVVSVRERQVGVEGCSQGPEAFRQKLEKGRWRKSRKMKTELRGWKPLFAGVDSVTEPTSVIVRKGNVGRKLLIIVRSWEYLLPYDYNCIHISEAKKHVPWRKVQTGDRKHATQQTTTNGWWQRRTHTRSNLQVIKERMVAVITTPNRRTGG